MAATTVSNRRQIMRLMRFSESAAALSTIGGTGFFATGVGDEDLYRYTAPGVRSFSTTQTTSPYSYFSINGGTTVPCTSIKLQGPTTRIGSAIPSPGASALRYRMRSASRHRSSVGGE